MRFVYKLIAKYYIKNTYFADWIWEKYQRPSNFLRMIINQICFLLKLKFAPFLLSVNLEPITQCNLKCKYCRGRYDFPIMNEKITLTQLNRLLKQIPQSVETIQLNIVGEPLLHPRILELINLTSKYGFRPIIFTNGTLLNSELNNQILSSHLDVLNISTETDSLNAREMRGIDIDKLDQNIFDLLEKRAKLKSNLKIKLALVLHSKNIMYISQFLKKWGNRVDGIKIVPTLSIDEKRVKGLCSELWRGNLNILPNGIVSACCSDFSNRLVVGDLKNTTLMGIWCGSNLQNLRLNFIKRNIPDRCNFCCTDECGNIDRFKHIPI